MKAKILIGLILLILSFGMFFFGAHVFTYRGESTDLFRDTGLICFIGWLPALVGGIVFLILGIGEIIATNKKH